MSKLEAMRREAGANVGESMGQGRDRAATPVASTIPARLQGLIKSKAAAEIPVDKIVPDPGQPRDEFDDDALARLAESMRTRGQLQPIRVRWEEARESYIIVCGERRWRAARMAGLSTVSCVIGEGEISPAELLALQVVENALREDLKPIEQARAYRALMDLHGWSGNQVSKELAIAQSSVVRALALLDLPAEIQGRVAAGDLAPSVAYQVSRIEDPEAQAAIVERIVAEDLNRDETAEIVRKAAGGKPGKGRGAKAGPPKPRTFRTSVGKVTIELRRAAGDVAIRAALAEVLAQLDGRAEADAA